MVWAFPCRRHKPGRILRKADNPGIYPKRRDFLATGGCALKRTVPDLSQAGYIASWHQCHKLIPAVRLSPESPPTAAQVSQFPHFPSC